MGDPSVLPVAGTADAVIGGLAVQWWSEPRVTRDVDLTVVAPLDQPSSVFVGQVLDRFPARIDNALEFARRNRVILVTASNGCPVDISLGRPWARIHQEGRRR